MTTATTSPTVEALKAFAVKTLTTASEFFVKDINAISHEDLGKSWGAGSRTGYDIAYEVAIINRRMAFWCRGENPGPMPWKFGEEWLKAPAEFQNKEAVIGLIKETADELLNCANGDIEKEVVIGEDEAFVYQMILRGAQHTSYHAAQLNFIQELTGDMAVHWD